MVFDGRTLIPDLDPSRITIATYCSHTSLQIFHGARKEGFRTLGICVGAPPRYFEAFPLARPDEFLILKDHQDLFNHVEELRRKNVVLVPHGSFVEYLGANKFLDLPLLTFGNRSVLPWESDRARSKQWLDKAGLQLPRHISDPRDIIEPVIVKYHGAKGGRGFFIARNYHEFKARIDETKPYTIQEFVLGTRYYLHYFYSPLRDDSYKLSQGSLQFLGVDRRDETNIDEANRLGSIAELEALGIKPTFVVSGNFPLVIRESLLPKVFRMGEGVVESSLPLFGGMIGPFCLETVVTDQLEFKVFEISARIVAGTNPYVGGSPYTEMIEPGLSTGRRIAQEIKLAAKTGRLAQICS
ncbi:MAG: 5-formaminoimidazole-4-carboxamide-(beta)-D-ribofuranosyl 5-monophosphate synthetase [Thermoplasmata archaeon]|jgi:5-formaminoimidazole-4-carboxamide-1-(beta)-D-ribofuranosyl 5'-monophosphate synthetase|nr:5-formaminoimidazole-4-carboxamide-(beta)-D-ribofuranosyl 5-monophosphate synthetase [Thermoplasmata archaeon]